MRKQAIILFLVSIVTIGAAYLFQDKLVHFWSLGLFGIFLINLFGSATIFFPAPAIASVVAGGAVYPPLFVAIVSALGGSFGEMAGFLLGQSSIRTILKNPIAVRVRGLLKNFGVGLIFIFALIPNPLFDAVGILAGALGYSPVWFFVAVFLGRLIRNALLAFGAASFNGP